MKLHLVTRPTVSCKFVQQQIIFVQTQHLLPECSIALYKYLPTMEGPVLSNKLISNTRASLIDSGLTGSALGGTAMYVHNQLHPFFMIVMIYNLYFRRRHWFYYFYYTALFQ